MKKKFTNKLKEKKILPLPLYYLEEDTSVRLHFVKMEKAGRINAPVYELLNFYKVISKF